MVIRMLTEIGSIDNVESFIDSVKEGSGGRLQGFGHRVYKNYDPRATIIKRTADDVFKITGKNPLLDIALKLEEIALSDEYFTLPPAVSQRRLLLRPDLPGHGIPARDVPGALRHPPHGGLAGALAGDARPGLQDRPAPPALHRRRRPPRTFPSPSAEPAPPRRCPAPPQASGRRLGPARIRPSWTIDTTKVPSRVNRKPRARPRAPKALRAVHVVEQPVVGPEGPVEPHAVVEAGPHELGVVPAAPRGGRAWCRTATCPRRRRPHRRAAAGRRGGCRRPGSTPAGRGPCRPRAASTAARRRGAGRWDGGGRTSPPARPARARAGRPAVASVSGSGTSGIGTWCERPLLVDVERRRHVEDGLPVLDGHHPPGGEGPPVADPVHLVEDGHVGVAGPEEVGVQRMGAGRAPPCAPPPSAPAPRPDRRRPAGGVRRGSPPGRC